MRLCSAQSYVKCCCVQGTKEEVSGGLEGRSLLGIASPDGSGAVLGKT